MTLVNLLLVGAGGFFGAIARYAVGTIVADRWHPEWPWGTFIINITGCFFIGFFLTMAAERATIPDAWRLVFSVGFVGAYTTFSTYEYETVRLVQTGAYGRALSYVVFSTVIGFATVFFAFWLARRIS